MSHLVTPHQNRKNFTLRGNVTPHYTAKKQANLNVEGTDHVMLIFHARAKRSNFNVDRNGVTLFCVCPIKTCELNVTGTFVMSHLPLHTLTERSDHSL